MAVPATSSPRPAPREAAAGRPGGRTLAGRGATGGALRRLGLVWALLPFLLLALLPAGAMPQRVADGVELVLCSGTGPVSVHVEDPGGPGPPSCPWALHAAGFLPAGPPALPPPVLRLSPAGPAALIPLRVRLAAVLGPSARGPPAFP